MTDAYAPIRCEFVFKCPKAWHLLDPTDVDTVRHCSACEREVFLVETDQELRTHAAAGRCVAVPVRESPASTTEEPSYMIGQVQPAYDTRSAPTD